ncbi:hypothetical protein HELRODRAFT_63669, partial [Helobdella robusta]|uniref:AAA+ ATPase domain-containing protein n=1 Tax=Helobdella robusta TaxID=6412 RepID=T1FXI8_HELRO
YSSTKQALTTSLPDFLVCRDAEFKLVKNYIADHIDQSKPGSMYISGAPGTGKTAVLNFALKSIPTSSPKVFINCMSLRNSQAIYSNIWMLLSPTSAKKSANSAKDAVADIEDFITSNQQSIILVLDEIDSLDSRNQEVLYTIFGWPSLKNSKLILVGIANSLDLTDRILPRLQSDESCKPQLMNFTPYSKDEISQIILNRLSKVCFVEGEQILDAPAVNFCSRKVSSMAGDLRMALNICTRAVEIVEMEVKKSKLNESAALNTGVKKVTVPVILKVINEVFIQKVALKTDAPMIIPLQQMLVMCTMLLMGKLAKGSKEITLGKLHENLNKVCLKNGFGRVDQGELLSHCLSIEDQGMMTIKKNKQVRLHKLSLRVNEQELESVIQDKTLLSTILQKGI